MSCFAQNNVKASPLAAFTTASPVIRLSSKTYRNGTQAVRPQLCPFRQNGQSLRRFWKNPQSIPLPFLLPCPSESSNFPQRRQMTATANPNVKDEPSPQEELVSGQQLSSSPTSSGGMLRSLWSFSRPHTIYGTFLSVLSLAFLATVYHGIPIKHLRFPLLTSLIPALLLNVYIVGLNQIHDIDIDRVNKPNLPLASKAMTVTEGYVTVVLSLLLGLVFCLPSLSTTPLRVVLIGSVILGTLYSVPPFRIKRFASLASGSILAVRGLLINLGFFLHMTKFGQTVAHPIVPPVLSFAIIFFTFFGLIIALLKDVPDIQGDRLFGIRTFSVRLGARAVFNICVSILVLNFIAAAVFYSVTTTSLLVRILTGIIHLAVAIHLFRKSRGVDPSNRDQVTSYYMLSWKAFYAEYLLLPLGIL